MFWLFLFWVSIKTPTASALCGPAGPLQTGPKALWKSMMVLKPIWLVAGALPLLWICVWTQQRSFFLDSFGASSYFEGNLSCFIIFLVVEIVIHQHTFFQAMVFHSMDTNIVLPRIILTWWWLLHGASETWLIWYHTGRIIIRMPFYRWYLDCILQTCHRLASLHTLFCLHLYKLSKSTYMWLGKVHMSQTLPNISEPMATRCFSVRKIYWPPFFSTNLTTGSWVTGSLIMNIQVWCSLAHWRGDLSGWWQLKYLAFSPGFVGKWFKLNLYVFQMGWNHPF